MGEVARRDRIGKPRQVAERFTDNPAHLGVRPVLRLGCQLACISAIQPRSTFLQDGFPGIRALAFLRQMAEMFRELIDLSFTVIKEQSLADGTRTLFWLQPKTNLWSADSASKPL